MYIYLYGLLAKLKVQRNAGSWYWVVGYRFEGRSVVFSGIKNSIAVRLCFGIEYRMYPPFRCCLWPIYVD